jgi:ribonuclease Y
VQAGRELRVMVQPEQLSDEQAYALARSISRKIEEELQYPGQIRVTVVRETRCIEYAK